MSREQNFQNISRAIDKMVLDDWLLNRESSSTNQLAPLMLEVFYYYLTYGHCDFRWFGHHYPSMLRILKNIGFCTTTPLANALDDIYVRSYPTEACQKYLFRVFHKHIQHHVLPEASIKDMFSLHPVICSLDIFCVIASLVLFVTMIMLPYKWVSAILLVVINTIAIERTLNHSFAFILTDTLKHDIRAMLSGSIAEPRTFKDRHNFYRFLNNIQRDQAGINELLFLYSLSKDNDYISDGYALKLFLEKVMFLNYNKLSPFYTPVIKVNGLQVAHNTLAIINVKNAQILAKWH